MNTQNGTFIQQQQPLNSGTITTPTSIVRLNQPISTQNQFTPQNRWTNNISQSSPKLQYSPAISKGKYP